VEMKSCLSGVCIRVDGSEVVDGAVLGQSRCPEAAPMTRRSGRSEEGRETKRLRVEDGHEMDS